MNFDLRLVFFRFFDGLILNSVKFLLGLFQYNAYKKATECTDGASDPKISHIFVINFFILINNYIFCCN